MIKLRHLKRPVATRQTNEPRHENTKDVVSEQVPLTILLYNKTEVCRGIPIILIFAQKHTDFG